MTFCQCDDEMMTLQSASKYMNNMENVFDKQEHALPQGIVN